MNKLIIFILFLFLGINISAQSADERIVTAINNERWFDLSELYGKHKAEIQTPILDPMLKFLTNHYSNQNDSALYYGAKLINEYNSELGGLVGNFIYLMSSDLARKGEYYKAASILKQYNNTLKAENKMPERIFIAYENQYSAIAERGGFSVIKPKSDVKVPIKHENGLINIDIKLNNYSCNAILDTGSGENIISKKMADKLGLYIYNFPGTTIGGISKEESSFAIADTLKIGNIIYKNIPFQVVDMTLDNEAANEAIDKLKLDCIIGMRSIFLMKEIKLDFSNNTLEIPESLSTRPSTASPIYCSGENTLGLAIYDKKTDQKIKALFDSGSVISELTTAYYQKNKKLFDVLIPTDSVKIAGIGNTEYHRTISIPWEYSFYNNDFKCVPISINTAEDNSATQNYDCLLGTPFMTRYKKIIINLNDMWIFLEGNNIKE